MNDAPSLTMRRRWGSEVDTDHEEILLGSFGEETPAGERGGLRIVVAKRPIGCNLTKAGHVAGITARAPSDAIITLTCLAWPIEGLRGRGLRHKHKRNRQIHLDNAADLHSAHLQLSIALMAA